MRKVECKGKKFNIIYRFKEKYSVLKMCKIMKVSRSGYYTWVKRIGKPDKELYLVELIKQCQAKSRKTYGYRRVKQWILRETKQNINTKAILRIMRKHGLLAEIRRPRAYKRYSKTLHKYENHLNRNFISSEPNKKWVTDISYIHTKQGVLYLSVIKDLYDNFIVSYKTGTEQDVGLVLNTIKEAKDKEKITTELQLHSDQGFQYTSTAYFNLTKEYDIIPSMSRRGNCLDNSPAENFFGIIKTECIYRKKITDFEEARQLIDEYIYFYNYERIQTKTMLTPYEKRCQLE